MTTVRRAFVLLGFSIAIPVSASDVRLSVRPLDLTRPPTTEELMAAGQLGGPLHPTRDDADTAQDRGIRLDFGRAIQTWNDHDYRSAVGLFRAHIERYPDSPWAAEAKLHIGCDAQYQGRYHEARAVYEGLIKRYRAATYPGARMIAHKARLRLAGLEVLQYDFAAAAEHFRILKAESPDWRHRTYAAHWIQRLSRYRSHEAALLTCGTQALASVLEARGQGIQARALRAELPATAHGQSIDDLVRLARSYGQKAQPRRLQVADLAAVPLPAIVHLEGSPSGKSGHYWVVEQARGGTLRLFDPQSGRRFEQTAVEFAREWDGSALLLSDREDLPGAPMDAQEKSVTRGGCCGAPARESNLGAPDPGSGSGTGNGNCAPVWDVNMINMNFYVVDTPLWFTPPYGPPVEIRLSYNSQSAIAYHEPFGAKWQFNYATYLVIDTGGNITVFMPDGRRDTYTPDGSGGFIPPFLVHDQLVAVGPERYELRQLDGTVHVYSMPRPAGGGTVTQLFLERIRDTRGLSLVLTYDVNGHLVTIADALGRLTTLSYDGADRVIQVADPFGLTAGFEYDADGNLTRVTDMGGYASTFAYDADRFITDIDGARGHWQFRTEPADGIPKWSDAYPPPGEPMWANYRVTVTNPLGDPYEYFYYGGCDDEGFGCAGYSWYVNPRDYLGWRSSEVNTYNSHVPKTRYLPLVTDGGLGAIDTIITPEGRRTRLSYDREGNISQVIDPAGHITRRVHGSRGQVLTSTDPSGAVTTFTHAPNEVDVTAITDGLGTTSITYNATREVTSITDRLGHTTTFAYNAVGQLTSVTDPLAVTTSFTYGGGAEPERATRSGQTVFQRTYDARGRVATHTDATGLTLTIAHDNLDRVTAVGYPDGRSRQFQYSGCCVERLESTTERSGQTTAFSYDDLSRRTEIHHPDGSVTRYGYDKNGNRTSLTDPEGNVTRFQFDLDDRLARRIFADGTAESYARNADGYVDLVTNARGQDNVYTYDSGHRLTGITFGDGAPPVAYTYDLFGRLVSRGDGIGTTVYAYDAESRRTMIDGPWPADAVAMEYDAAGRLTRVAVDGGAPTVYSYDVHGRLQAVEHGGGSFVYGYSGSTPLPTSLTRPNGVATTYAYDALNRLQQVTHRKTDLSVISRLTYAYDLSDRRASETTEGGLPVPALASRLATSQYDDADRLLSSTAPPRAYGYDADGSQTAGYAPGGAPSVATYDSENHILSFEYTSTDGHALRNEYAYDGDGWLVRLVERNDGVVTRERRFVRGPRLFLQERDGSNAVVAEYAWDPGRPGGVGGLLKRRASAQDYYYLDDAAGNVTAVLNAAQQTLAAYRYDPFGRLEGESGALAQEFRFSTKFLDSRSGLSYFGFRFYTPDTGRWLTRDPLRERGGPNLYAFAENDPLNVLDPWGLAPRTGPGGGGSGSSWGGPGTYGDPGTDVCGRGSPRNWRWSDPTRNQRFRTTVGKVWKWLTGDTGSGWSDTGDDGPNAVVGVRG